MSASSANNRPASADPHRIPLARVTLWMAGTVAAFTFMALAGRQAGHTLDTFEIMLFRSLIGLVLVLSFGGWRGTLGQISTRRMPLHIARNLAHFAGQNLWFFALKLILLTQVFALEFTAPLWVVLLAPLFIGETLTARKLACVALGFIGILLVAQPDMGNLNPGVIAAAGAAVFFALTAIMTRRLTATESITSIMFWLTILQTIFGLICAGYDGVIHLPQGSAIFWVIVISVAGLCGHFCLTTALSLAPASTVMPIDFARLPVIAIIDMVFYDEPFHRLVLAGAGLIVLANWINLRGPRTISRTIPPDAKI